MNKYLWPFFIGYMVVMVLVGIYATKITKSEDDYATARKCYPWWVIGLIIPATFSSGGTFMGSGGMAYGIGFPSFWYFLLYPIGGYLGMALLARFARGMNTINARTVPEYLGARYQSDVLRVISSILAIFLCFYIAGQIIAAGTIFSMLMGVSYKGAIWISAAAILLYITFGGAHADFLTDSIQSVVMILIAIVCVVVFVFGVGLEGGGGMFAVGERIAAIAPELGPDSLFNPNNNQYNGWFPVIMMFFAHVPFILLPHFGVKWAGLNKLSDMPKALWMSAIVGLLFAFGAPLPGLLARAVLATPLDRADMALPAIFGHLFPDYITALLIVGILCAVMSTADGLFLTISQIFANDLYRLTFAPKLSHSEQQIERNSKWIARVVVVLAAVVSVLMVYNPPPYLTLFHWLGIGGVVAGISGPLLIGILWRGVTKTAVTISFIVNVSLYAILVIGFDWAGMTATGITFIFSSICTILFSLVTTGEFSDEHLVRFGFPPRETGKQVSL